MASSPPGGLLPGYSHGVTRILLAVLASLSWMLVSSLLILLNKYIMVDLKFKYPMTVSGMGMMASSIASYVCCRVLNIVETHTVVSGTFYARNIMPVGFFMALTLFAGNQVYLYLTVSFIQMLKAFTPVITMIALFLAGLEAVTCQMIAAILAIACGTAFAAYGEMNMSLIGVMCMLLSETAEAVRLVMTQYLLVGLKLHPIEGLMYLAPACSFWLMSGALAMEARHIIELGAWNIMKNNSSLFLVSAFMGFMVNTLAYTTIKLASSLTLKVLGTVKNALLVTFAVIFMAEKVTLLQAVGYTISIAGFAWYNKIKMKQMAGSGKG